MFDVTCTVIGGSVLKASGLSETAPQGISNDDGEASAAACCAFCSACHSAECFDGVLHVTGR